MLIWLGWVLLAILALAVCALALPVHLTASARTAPSRAVRVTARALGGHAPPIRIADSTRPRKPKDKAKPRRRRKSAASSTRARAGLVPDLIDLGLGLLSCIRFQRLDADATFSLGDPALTGAVWGRLTPLIYGLGSVSGIRLDLRPDFGTPNLNGQIEAEVAVTPLSLVPPFLRFGLARIRAR